MGRRTGLIGMFTHTEQDWIDYLEGYLSGIMYCNNLLILFKHEMLNSYSYQGLI